MATFIHFLVRNIIYLYIILGVDFQHLSASASYLLLRRRRDLVGPTCQVDVQIFRDRSFRPLKWPNHPQSQASKALRAVIAKNIEAIAIQTWPQRAWDRFERPDLQKNDPRSLKISEHRMSQALRVA